MCVCVQNRCTSGLISCAVEASVTPRSKDSIELRVKRLPLFLSQTSLSTNSFFCMAGKRTAILPRSEKAGVSEKDRDTETEYLLFDEVPPAALWPLRRSCSPFPLPLFVSVHHPRLFLCLLIPSTSPILIVFSFGDCSPRQVFIIFYYYIIIIIIFYRSLVPGN